MRSQRIDHQWRFLHGDPAGAENPGFDDTSWRLVDLPHDWSIEGPYSKKNTPQNAWLPAGVGWYRRMIDVPDAWLSRHRLGVRFEGVYMNSRVWINGRQVGGRPYGFMTFACDLTDHLHTGRNLLAVRVDNTPAPTARFYHGGGIYGHVDLLLLPDVHIVPDGGVFVRTTGLNGNQADIAITTEVRNLSRSDEAIVIRHTVIDPEGRSMGLAVSRESTVAASDVLTHECSLTLDGVKPWSPSAPHLYTVETAIQQNGRVIDRTRTPFGVRSIAFKADTGFWLNGQNIKLKGVCEHQELLPVGLAVPDDMMAWRIRKLKAMGCNAIRTAHNPFTPTFLDLCDRLGIMVMDEIFDGWHKKGANDYGGRFFEKWWQRDVTDWVRRDRNHPSVILYSIGNETGHRDEHNITALIHTHDSTRSTTGGTVFQGVDVSGFNGPGGMPGVLEAFHDKHPNQPVVLTEVPHTIQTRGFYRVPTWWRDWPSEKAKIHTFAPYGEKQIFFDGNSRYRSSYDNCGVRINARTSWKRTRDTPWISGEFRWTGFDSLGECQFMGAEFPKRSYNSGVIDFAGIPKDLYFFYQSQWTDEPMVHLLPHWTHPGLAEGTKIPVVAYSNGDEVELFLNGKSLGRRKPGTLLDFVWHVPWTPGELRAVAYRGDRQVADCTMRTAGRPNQLMLSMKRLENIDKAGADTAILTACAVDRNGVLVPWANHRVHFRPSGHAVLLGYENGDPMDGTDNRETWRDLFYGYARGFFKVPAGSTKGGVVALAILGEQLFKDRTTVCVDCQWVGFDGAARPLAATVYYTLDGSEPTAKSRVYETPFVLETTRTVRALAMVGGREIAKGKSEFRKGSKPRITDPRWASSVEGDTK